MNEPYLRKVKYYNFMFTIYDGNELSLPEASMEGCMVIKGNEILPSPLWLAEGIGLFWDGGDEAWRVEVGDMWAYWPTNL